MIEIRAEEPADADAIRELNDRAFAGTAEGRLVDHLRSGNKAAVSLVAVNGLQVVGHILFSTVSVAQAPDGVTVAGLGPMSVAPALQRTGIGTRLVLEGLEACRHRGYDAVVVLGHTHFYSRFGFVRAADYGLDNEYDASDSFMVLPLHHQALEGVKGLVMYAPEFSAVAG